VTYCWKNRVTDKEIVVECELSQIEEFLDYVPDPENWFRLMQLPNVTRASFVDGTKRSGFAEMREALKLERESYKLKPSERTEIKREIRKVKHASTSKPDK